MFNIHCPALKNALHHITGTKCVCFNTSVAQPSSNPIFDEIDTLQRKQKMSVLPLNAWHEQMQWTEEGKIWKFPIDNEQGE